MGSQKVHTNKFYKGIDKDTDDKFKPNDVYKDGFYVELTNEGGHGSIKALNGSSLIGSVLGTHNSYVVMGSQDVLSYIVGSGIERCVVFFIATSKSGPIYEFHIVVYRVSTGLFYEVYEETVTSSYMTGTVDSVIASESGIDTLYFTSKLFEPRRLRCYFNISTPTKTSREIELWRRYPSNKLAVTDVLYNPKSSNPVGDLHKLYFDGSFTTDTSTHKVWEGDALLDVDTSGTDQFEFDFEWIKVQQVAADSNTSVYSKIDLKDQAGASISGFPKTNTLGPVSGAPDPRTYQNGPTLEGVISGAGAYNATAFSVIIEINILDNTGYYFGYNRINLRNIDEYAGGDSYQISNPWYQDIQLAGGS